MTTFPGMGELKGPGPDTFHPADVLLAVGSSLTVHPAAGLVGLAAAAGADVVIANAEPTPYDEMAWAVLRGPLSEVLPDLVATG